MFLLVFLCSFLPYILSSHHSIFFLGPYAFIFFVFASSPFFLFPLYDCLFLNCFWPFLNLSPIHYFFLFFTCYHLFTSLFLASFLCVLFFIPVLFLLITASFFSFYRFFTSYHLFTSPLLAPLLSVPFFIHILPLLITAFFTYTSAVSFYPSAASFPLLLINIAASAFLLHSLHASIYVFLIYFLLSFLIITFLPSTHLLLLHFLR